MSKQVKKILTWVGAIFSLAGLISVGIWIGSIQTSLSQMETDIRDNEILAKANKAYFIKIDDQERGRLNEITNSIRSQLDDGKDEKWRVKNAISGIWREIRYRHGERVEDLAYGGRGPAMQPEAPARPTETEVSRIAEEADEAIEDVVQPVNKITKLQKLMF